MKTTLLLLSIFVLALSTSAQTPEEVQAKKMLDSIMSTLPEEQKGFMEQMLQKGEEAEQQRKKQKEDEQKAQAQKQTKAQEASVNEFYWRNTIASGTDARFKNWGYGTAKIRARFYNRTIRDYVNVPMGQVSADGKVTISLPVVDIKKLGGVQITANYSEGEPIFGDHLTYSNQDIHYVSSRYTLEVHQGDNVLGYLKMGNSIKPVVNLNAPCCFGKAGDGYIAYWVYTTGATEITGTSQFKTIKDSDMTQTYDMRFKAGWNIIKADVRGEIAVGSGTPYWKEKKFTVLSGLPDDAKYYFMKAN